MNPSTEPAVSRAPFPKLRLLLEYLDRIHEPADLETLRRLLVGLEVTREDLAPACIFKDEGYQRNLVKETEWYELVCICWTSGQRTPIHDHKGSACAFRVVEGIATETRFERTPSGLILASWTKHHDPGYVCASAEADIHQVANTQPQGQDLVTLHCYTPQLRNFNVYTLDTPTASDPRSVRRNDIVK